MRVGRPPGRSVHSEPMGMSTGTHFSDRRGAPGEAFARLSAALRPPRLPTRAGVALRCRARWWGGWSRARAACPARAASFQPARRIPAARVSRRRNRPLSIIPTTLDPRVPERRSPRPANGQGRAIMCPDQDTTTTSQAWRRGAPPQTSRVTTSTRRPSLSTPRLQAAAHGRGEGGAPRS